MTNDERYDHARFAIGRYDHYFDTVNSKGAFYIGLNTFLLGSLFAGFISLYTKPEMPGYLWIIVFFFAANNIASSIITVIAIHPFTSSRNTGTRSLLFFASVGQYERDNFIEAFMQQDEFRRNRDTVCQMWHLSRGLTRKFKLLKVAGFLIIVQFITIIPILFLITKIIKP